MKVVNLVQRTPEWHAWRHGKIGGSDAPVINGTSPHKTYRDLYLEKKNGSDQDDPSKKFIFERGDALELIARRDIFELTGHEIIPLCAEMEGEPSLIASLDGYHEKVGPVEIKLIGKDALKLAIDNQEVPVHHYDQIQHQLMVCNMDKGFWLGGLKTGEAHMLEIARNEDYIRNLFVKEKQFLDELQNNVTPPLSDKDFLVPDDLTLLFQLKEAKDRMDNAKIMFDGIKDMVIEKHKHGRIAGAGIQVVRSERTGTIDYKKIPAINGLSKEELEAYRGKSSVSWTVTTKKEEV